MKTKLYEVNANNMGTGKEYQYKTVIVLNATSFNDAVEKFKAEYPEFSETESVSVNVHDAIS